MGASFSTDTGQGSPWSGGGCSQTLPLSSAGTLFPKNPNYIGCIKILSMGIGLVGHSLPQSGFKLGPLKFLLKNQLLPVSCTAFLLTATIADTCGGRKALIPAGKAEKWRTISLKFCYERGRFQRSPKKNCIQLSGNALGIDFTYFFAASQLVLQP